MFGRQPMTRSACGRRASILDGVCISSKYCAGAPVLRIPIFFVPNAESRFAIFEPMSPVPKIRAVLPSIVRNGAGLVVLHVELEVYSVETACGVNLVNG